MDRVLFIPSDHGGGMGHVSRCLFFARRLSEQQVPTAIVLEQQHYQQLQTEPIQKFLLNTRGERWLTYHIIPPFRDGLRLARVIFRRPVFVEFSGLAFQVPRDGYLNTAITERRFRQLVAIAESFKPTVLVGDAHFLTRLLGKYLDVPVVQITRQAGFPPRPQFVWWKDVPSGIQPPDALAPFQSLLDRVGLGNVQRAEDLLRGDRYIIPAIPEIEPVPAEESVVYAGPFTEIPSGENIAAEKTLPLVYVTIGGGAGRGVVKPFFEKIIRLFHQHPVRVLISTAGKVSADSLRTPSPNIEIRDWVDGRKAIAESNVVIFHGGYGTFMEVLSMGKAAIVIPSHTEQEGNGRRLEALQVGQVSLLHNPEELEPLPFRWRYGPFQMLAAFSLRLHEEEILHHTISLLENPPMDRLQRIQKALLEAQHQTDFRKLVMF